MDLPVILLGAVVVTVGVVAWVRERRTWQTILAVPARDPVPALASVLQYHALRQAGLRSRYKLAHAGFALHQAHSSLNQTAEVKVHRDDLARAHQVRAGSPGTQSRRAQSPGTQIPPSPRASGGR